MARIAASWMLAGVPKSGSPSAKSRMSNPSAFSRFASAAIASVADGAINPDRSANVNDIAHSLPQDPAANFFVTDHTAHHTIQCHFFRQGSPYHRFAR